MVHGAAASAPAEERLAGLVPTPSLPERSLEELAAQPSIVAVASLLAALEHPFGSAMLADARLPHPDLLRLELLVNRAYAARALAAARRAPRRNRSRRDLLTFARVTIDLENAWTALQLAMVPAGAPTQVDFDSLFVDGGRWLDRLTFRAVARTGSVAAAVVRLARAGRTTPSPLTTVFAGLADSRWEDAALRAELRRTRAAARRSPLGVAPVIAFFIRLRAEVRDLRFIIWRVALGAPPATFDQLVSVT